MVGPVRASQVDITQNEGRDSIRAGGLNRSQRSAVDAVLHKDKKVVLIQGPPGTGKTSTIAALLKLVYLENRRRGKVIVCSHANGAIDEALLRLVAYIPNEGKGVMVRVGRNAREEVQPYTLDGMVAAEHERERDAWFDARKGPFESELEALEQELLYADKKRRKKIIVLISECKCRLVQLREESIVAVTPELVLVEEFIRKARFVFGTCSSLGSGVVRKNLGAQSIDLCVMDEAAQALEVAALIPIGYHPGKLVLVGDPKQLAPMIRSNQSHLNFGLTLMERLMKTGGGVPLHLLNEQYRMHPEIAKFPSDTFYDGKVITAPSVNLNHLVVPPRFPDTPVVFVNVYGAGDTRKGTSSINTREADVCANIARIFGNTRNAAVGVISPYKQQMYLIRSLLERELLNDKMDIEVQSVDAFQGREKDVIVFSCVRSGGQGHGVGFLADERRLNVAITRAKRALWIVGNVEHLRVHGGPVWSGLVRYCEKLARVVDVKDIDGL